ncbi:MAG: hydrogenase maturation protease [Gammaproteobacteria bacterium]|nr:hydrogenase maturation protease [Gammaproteobacteria bacterium]
MTHSPILIFGYGNPSRGDDALGPELLRLLEQGPEAGLCDMVTDFQLQIEHAMDLEGRELVLFVDASVAALPPYEFSRLQPVRDDSFTTHALSPAAVLSVLGQISKAAPPAVYLLTIPGYDFGLGRPITEPAAAHLEQACVLGKKLLAIPDQEVWEGYCGR